MQSCVTAELKGHLCLRKEEAGRKCDICAPADGIYTKLYVVHADCREELWNASKDGDEDVEKEEVENVINILTMTYKIQMEKYHMKRVSGHPSTLYHPLFTLYHPLFTLYHPVSTGGHPFSYSTIPFPNTTTSFPPATIPFPHYHHLSTGGQHLSTSGHPPYHG